MTVITGSSVRTTVARASLSYGSALRMMAEHVIDIVDAAYGAWNRRNYQLTGYQNRFGFQLEEGGELNDLIVRGRETIRRCSPAFKAESDIPALATELLEYIEAEADIYTIESAYRKLVSKQAFDLVVSENRSTSTATAYF